MHNTKIIIVVYLGAKHLPPKDVARYRDYVQDQFSWAKGDPNIILMVIPQFETYETRVECINPVLLTEQEYEGARKALDKFESAVEQLQQQIEDTK